VKKILCLDFDGVICDSVNENLLIAYNSYQIFDHRNHNIVDCLDRIPTEISNSFRNFRYLVRPAGEFWLLLYALYAKTPNLNQKTFNEMSSHYQEVIAAFERTFFETREKFQKQHPKEWLNLHRLYPQFSEAWPKVQPKFEVYIVTTKNLLAITRLLKYFNISIPENRIWAREKFNEKKEVIEFVVKNHDISSENIIFIDDHPLHLQDVEKAGIQCFWASWGYTKERSTNCKKISHLKEIL